MAQLLRPLDVRDAPSVMSPAYASKALLQPFVVFWLAAQGPANC